MHTNKRRIFKVNQKSMGLMSSDMQPVHSDQCTRLGRESPSQHSSIPQELCPCSNTMTISNFVIRNERREHDSYRHLPQPNRSHGKLLISLRLRGHQTFTFHSFLNLTSVSVSVFSGSLWEDRQSAKLMLGCSRVPGCSPWLLMTVCPPTFCILLTLWSFWPRARSSPETSSLDLFMVITRLFHQIEDLDDFCAD